ncbi:sugar phosphate nucleotidyltransferase [Candidatus Poriferisodalis sp.]|uniref:sugar phosphate nucleotidyltransferase n=1 Tax=Candidatus Poriferisodalis sp. TaxID=3101277 RepID=UPI003B0131EF
MKAILLLGGFGTRLRPLTNDTPKQMLPVCGRPMIEWVCEHLHRHGVDEVVLSLGYRAEAFTAAYPHGRIGQLAYEVAVEPDPRGTAGAVRFAAEASGITGTFLVLNGDVLTDLDIGALASVHERSGAEATIALQPVADPAPYGLVATDAAGQVMSFSEKPEPGSAPAALQRDQRPTISAGIYVLTPAVLDRIPPGRAVSIEREVFPHLVADQALWAMTSDTYWLDTGTPQQYLAANLDILEGRRADAEVADGMLAASDGIHPEAQVRTSVIGRGCEIGPGAVVQRSVVGDGCRLAAGAIVIDSMLGAGAAVGAGATLCGYTVLGSGEQVPPGAVLRAQRQPPPEPVADS